MEPQRSSTAEESRKRRRFLAPIAVVLAGCAFGVVWPSAIKAIRFRAEPGAWAYVAVLGAPALIYLGLLFLPAVFPPRWRIPGKLFVSVALGAACLAAGAIIALLLGALYAVE